MALRRLGSLLGPGVERAIGQQSCSSGRLFQTLTGICNDAASFGAFKSAADESQLPWRKQARQRISVPLTLPLPGVMPELPYRATPEPPPTEITVLDNGVRIVSESSPVSG